MPTLKQMEKLANAVEKSAPGAQPLGPNDDMPPEYWQAVLNDADAELPRGKPALRTRQLRDMTQHVLRVSCRRCERTVEIQKADAVRLYGPEATWKDVAQRLLDNTCQQRTGRYEEDGCWPSLEA